MAKKMADVRRQTFLCDSTAVSWYVKVREGGGEHRYVDAEFRAWDGSSSITLWDDLDVIERALHELSAYAKALRRAQVNVEG